MVRKQKGERGRKKLICGKKVTLAALSIPLWFCIGKKPAKMKQMKLSNHSRHSGKQYHLKPACILNSFMFL